MIAWVLVRDEFRGKAVRQRADRPAFRAAHDRRRADAARALRPKGPVGDQRRLHAGGLAMALLFVTLPFVVRAVQPVLHGARPRDGGGGGVARRAPAARSSAASCCPTCCPRCSPAAASASRGDRRVRLGRADLGQPPVQDRGRLGLHLRADRVRQHGRRRGGPRRAARRLVPHLARRSAAARPGGHAMQSRASRSGSAGSRSATSRVLLAAPVGVVFYRAFEHGIGAAWAAVTTPEALHAFWLTVLMVADRRARQHGVRRLHGDGAGALALPRQGGRSTR